MAAVVDGTAMSLGLGQGPMGIAGQAEETKIQEYRKIIKFGVAVVAGEHPRFKVPAHLVPKSPKSRSLSTSAIQQSTQQLQQQPAINGGGLTENHRAFTQNAQYPPQPMNLPGLDPLIGGIGIGHQDDQRPAGAHPEINPIFLEKSDQLLRAEFQIKRSRKEQALKDQIEHRRLVKLEIQRATDQQPDFNFVDVLRKSLALVHPQPTDPKTAASKPAADDSFDENTFYSSNFSTPNSAHVARVPANRSEDEDVHMDESSDYEPDVDFEPLSKPTASAPRTINNQPALTSFPPAQTEPFLYDIADDRPPAHANNCSEMGRQDNVAGNSQYLQTRPQNHRVSQMISSHSHESGEASTVESGLTDNEQSVDEFGRRRPRPRLDESRASRGEPAVIRTHHLSPIAPQPAHISSLANAANSRRARISPDVIVDLSTTRGTPAQVAALKRNEATITSPESSPQTGNGQGKRRQKGKNKRKADRQAERAPSPYIKPEPRSPSPMNAPAFVRPNKRQKQGPGHAQQAEYEPARYEAAPVASPVDGGAYRTRIYRDDTGAVVYERQDSQFAGQASRPIVVEDSGRRVYDSYEGRYLERSQMGRPASRGVYRIPSAAPIIQRPMSRAFVELPTQTGYAATPRIESRIYEAPRVSMRPPGDRDRSRSPVMRARSPVMAPPSRANGPRKIIVDEYGREYIEPPRPAPSVIRQSVPPTSRTGGSDVVYERGPAPMRAVSRMPDTFEQDGVIYRRASPAYPPARRVVTQPEYATPEQPIYRSREYSVRPSQSEYAPVRQATTRPVEEQHRDYEYGYSARSASMRPPESVRYEAASAYEYPEARDPQLIQSGQPVMTRAYSVRPPESAPIVQRPYSVRPVDHQPQQPVYGSRQIISGDEEVAYIEGLRGQEVRYEDVHRGEFY